MNDKFTPEKTIKKAGAWKLLLIAVIVIAVVSSGLWYWRTARLNSTGGWHGGGPIDVVTTTLTSQHAPLSIDAIGEVRAVNQVTLASQLAGRITAIHFEPGQQVHAGEVLVQLDDAPEQADLKAALAAKEFASAQVKRAEDLAKIDAIADEILQQRQADFDRFSAQVEQLKARIKQLRVVAPFTGELGLRQVDLGQYINPGEVIATLTALDAVFVNFALPQQELARINVGQSVSVSGETTRNKGLPAVVTAIEKQINVNTRNVTFQAKLNNEARQLHPGMYVTVQVSIDAQTDVLLLPKTAIMTSSNGNTAVVVRNISPDGVGTADIVPIKIDRYIDDTVAISQGVQAGDVVVTTGQLRVRPGAQLRVEKAPVSNSALLK